MQLAGSCPGCCDVCQRQGSRQGARQRVSAWHSAQGQRGPLRCQGEQMVQQQQMARAQRGRLQKHGSNQVIASLLYLDTHPSQQQLDLCAAYVPSRCQPCPRTCIAWFLPPPPHSCWTQVNDPSKAAAGDIFAYAGVYDGHGEQKWWQGDRAQRVGPKATQQGAGWLARQCCNQPHIQTNGSSLTQKRPVTCLRRRLCCS